MKNWFSVFKKIISTILNHTSFFKAKLKCSPRSTKDFPGFTRGFVISDVVFGHENLTYNPNPAQELNLFIEFSGFTTLQSLVSKKQSRSDMRSDNLSYNPSTWMSLFCFIFIYFFGVCVFFLSFFFLF